MKKVINNLKAYSFFIKGFLYLKFNNKYKARNYYLKSLFYGLKRNELFEILLANIINLSTEEVYKFAVSGWELSHNAAGRAITLANLYDYLGYDVDIIGCLISNKKRKRSVWEPLKENPLRIYYFRLYNNEIQYLLPKAIKFVIDNPYEVVHLSKPRITNIVLGFLYKFIWGANVFLDIDDEELAFSGESYNSSLKIDSGYLALTKEVNLPNMIRDPYWTQISVGLIKFFQCRTVSNPALAEKYQGITVPHIRDERLFNTDLLMNGTDRKIYNIPEDAIVVLFFGTPKRHKGLISTAHALSAVDDPRVVFLIVGNFIDLPLKTELMDISGVNYLFLPNQPYESAAKIASLGDICILMQNKDDPISNFQLPAKLIDALASGMKIFLQTTPATKEVGDYTHIDIVDKKTLIKKLSLYLKEYDRNADEIRKMEQYDYFLRNFSMSSVSSSFSSFIENNQLEGNDISLAMQLEFISEITGLNLLEFINYCIKKSGL